MRAPLVPVTLAWLSGILLGTSVHLPPASLIVVGAVSAGVSLWWWRRASAGVVALLLLWGCLGALRMTVWEAHPAAELKALLSDDPQPVQLHGLVVDDPVELFEPGDAHAGAEAETPVDPDRQVCVLELRHVRVVDGPSTSLKRRWQPINGRVRATINEPRELLRYGDEIVAEGQWSRVPSPGNPGQYDWQAALARKRIHGLLRVRPYDGLVVLRSGHHRGARGVPNARAFGRHGQGHPILAAVFRLRQRWERLIQARFNTRDAGLLLGLLLGQRAEIDEDVKEAFRTTGTIHLLVISGFNVGLVAGILEICLRLFGWPWRVRVWVLGLSLGGYCLLTGGQAPVVRATLMAWILLGSVALDRVMSWPNAVAAAALGVLLVDPTQLFDPGFQLSFGAVVSLLVFASRWHGGLQRALRWMRPAWLRRYVAVSVSATSAVWLGLAPVLTWYFHVVSPISLLANVLIAPLMSMLIALGTSLLMLATGVEAVMAWGHPAMTWLLDATIRCVMWCHALPWGHWIVGAPSPWLLCGYYGLLGVSRARSRLGWRMARVLAAWMLGLALWTGAVMARVLAASRWLRVDVLDVGHGASMVLRTPRGRAVVVDAGTPDAGRFRLIPFLQAEGITRVDDVILTHSDADHLGGAIPLLRTMPVRRLLTNGDRGDTMSARFLHQLASARGVPEMRLSAGWRWREPSGVTLEVLHPPYGLVSGSAPASNDNSVVLRVADGAVRMVLSGDIEEQGLARLMQAGEPLEAQVLTVPHHGSRLGDIGERFFDAVRPDVAILSVGRSRHLPAPETIRAITRRGIAVYSTRDDGAIQLRTDGRCLEVKTFRRSRRWERIACYAPKAVDAIAAP